MGFGIDLAALLGGAAKEAAAVRTERHDQENQNFMKTMSVLTQLHNDPAASEQVLQQTRQGMMDTLMGHLGYQSKTAGKSPVMKAIKGLVGPSPNDYSASVQGIGSGNAKTPVGGMGGGPPAPQGQMTQQPMGGSEIPSMDFGDGGQPPAPPMGASTAESDIPTRGWLTGDQQNQRAVQYEVIKTKALAKAKMESDQEKKQTEWSTIIASPEYKKLASENPREASAMFFHHWEGAMPIGSTNLQTDPQKIKIDTAIKLYAEGNPEIAELLQSYKENGIEYVLGKRSGANGTPSTFIPASPDKPSLRTITGVVNAASPTGFSTQLVDNNNPNGPPVASFDTQANNANTTRATTAPKISYQIDKAGNIHEITNMVTSTTGPVGKDGAVPTPGPPQSTDKILPFSAAPKESMPRFEGQRKALINTVDIMDKIKTDLPLLTSMFTAGKIALAQSTDSDGYIKLALSRMAPLSEAESRMAGNLNSMAEHINTLRGPLGATGFRSEEAFINLLLQGGSALANPAATKVVLDNSLQALTGQIGGHNRALSGYAEFPETFTPLIIRVYKNLYNPDGRNQKEMIKKLQEDGYQVE